MKQIYFGDGKWATIFEAGDFGDGSCLGSLMIFIIAAGAIVGTLTVVIGSPFYIVSVEVKEIIFKILKSNKGIIIGSFVLLCVLKLFFRKIKKKLVAFLFYGYIFVTVSFFTIFQCGFDTIISAAASYLDESLEIEETEDVLLMREKIDKILNDSKEQVNKNGENWEQILKIDDGERLRQALQEIKIGKIAVEIGRLALFALGFVIFLVILLIKMILMGLLCYVPYIVAAAVVFLVYKGIGKLEGVKQQKEVGNIS